MATTAQNESVGDAEAFVRTSTEVHEAPEGDVLGSLGLNGTLFVGQLINFLIVLLVLWRFAYKPLMKLMDERSKKIEQGLKRADEMESRVEELEREREQVMKGARREAKETVERAQAQAKERHDALLNEAKESVERMTLAAQEQMRREKDQLMNEAQSELAVLVVDAATRVAGEALDAKKAEKAAAHSIDKVAKGL